MTDETDTSYRSADEPARATRRPRVFSVAADMFIIVSAIFYGLAALTMTVVSISLTVLPGTRASRALDFR